VTTKVVEFNNVPALEAALAAGDVAAVLAEPVMTNIGIIHPQPGFHQQLREITRRYSELPARLFPHGACMPVHASCALLLVPGVHPQVHCRLLLHTFRSWSMGHLLSKSVWMSVLRASQTS
jgi:hypothetical protein